VAYTDIGMVGWISDLVIVDMAGLTDTSFSGATGLDWRGRAAYLGERAPDWIILKEGGRERFEAISSSPWLVENYYLEEGPRGTIAARRKDVLVATDAEILAAYEQAVEREPHSSRFLWRRALWASAVGTQAQLDQACEALSVFDDQAESASKCRKMKLGRARPLTAPEPLAQKRRRLLAGEPVLPPEQAGAEKASPKATATTPKRRAASKTPAAVALSERPTPSKKNPFSRPGAQGIGKGWVAYPKGQIGTLAMLGDDQLRIEAHGEESFSACTKKIAAAGSVTLTGAWRTEGIEGGQAELYLLAFDAQEKLVRFGNFSRFWPLAQATEPGWWELDVQQALSEEVVRVRLCASLPAAAGSAWLQDLQLQQR